jgi:hypothetical protein
MAPSAIAEGHVISNGKVAGLSNDIPPTNGVVKQTATNADVATSSDFQFPPVIPDGTPYTILDQYHSKPTKLRVACIGAGASGLCLAYKMNKMMIPDSWELTLFEKNPVFGGTWYENTYPGVACDVSI